MSDFKNFCEILCKNLDPIARVTELFLQLIIKPQKFSVKFSAKVEIQKNFWELGSQDPILFPPLAGGIFNAIVFSAAGFLFSKLNHQGYEAEMKNHNKALELLAKSIEEFYEKEVKRKSRMDELRMEIANARISEQQTDKAFILLNKELKKLQEEDNVSRNRRSPTLSDFYTPSQEMHKYQTLSSIIVGSAIGFAGLKIYKY